MPHNRQQRRKAARKGKTIKPVSAAALRADAARVLSRTQLAALTQSGAPLTGDEGAALGRRFAELTSAIESLPEGSAEQQELVIEQIAVMNTLQNGGRYYNSVQRRIDRLMEGEPGPTRPAEPNVADPAERWRSADTRYYEQTALARGLTEACAPALGRARANAFAMELLEGRKGNPYRMLQPAQQRQGASDSHHREAMQQMAVRRWVFDAVVEDVPRTEILRRANGSGSANLIEPATLDHWLRDTDKRELELDEQIALHVRDGTEASLPVELQIKLLQLRAMTFPEWVQLALRRD